MFKKLLSLFLTFAKIGGITFGGGLTMLPLLTREIVEKRKWATEEELLDYYAVGQCTPGIIAVNVATFTGKKVKGIPGAIAATLGIVFPSVVIITIIAAVISNFADIAWVQNAFAGIRVCVSVFIINAVLKLWKSGIVDVVTFIIFAIVFAGSIFLSVSPVLYVIIAAIAGIICTVVGVRKK